MHCSDLSEQSERSIGTGRKRIVILIGGLKSQSQVTADDHALVNDFALIRAAIAFREPGTEFIYFSYGVARSSVNPMLAWRNHSWRSGSEPVYSGCETTDQPLTDHVLALEWLIWNVQAAEPTAIIDLVGFSLGGMVALAWAARTVDVTAIHRIVLVSVPVGGITSLGLLTAMVAVRTALRRYDIDFGRSLVFRDVHSGSPLLDELGTVPDRVDVSAVENVRDFVVNGKRICGQAFTSSVGSDDPAGSRCTDQRLPSPTRLLLARHGRLGPGTEKNPPPGTPFNQRGRSSRAQSHR